MQETDSHLLARFASHRDEAAFGQLTARHLGLIYYPKKENGRVRGTPLSEAAGVCSGWW